MAINVGTAGNGYADITSGLGSPSTGAFTVIGRSKLLTDRNAASTILCLFSASSDYCVVQTNADGTTLRADINGNNTGTQALTVGTGFHWAIKGNRAGAGLLSLHYRPFGSGTTTKLTGNNPAGWTISELVAGNTTFDEQFNGAIEHLMFWGAALSDANIDSQFAQGDPITTSNLIAWWKMTQGNLAGRLLDSSGNGRNLTSNGTIVAVDNLIDFPVVSKSLDSVGVSSSATVASSGISGSASITLGDTTVVAAAMAALRASVAQQLDSLTAASTATHTAVATASVALQEVGVAATATGRHVVTATVALDAVTVAATAAVPHEASVAVQLGDVTLATAGTGTHVATASIELGSIAVASAADTPAQASLVVGFTLADVVCDVVADVPVLASASQTLDAIGITSSAQAGAVVSASTDVALDDVTLSATATAAVKASIAIALDSVAVAAQAAHSVLAAAAIALDTVAIQVVAAERIQGAAAVTLDAVALSASIGVEEPSFDAEVDVVLGSVVVSSVGTVSVQATAVVAYGSLQVTVETDVSIQAQAAIQLGDVTSYVPAFVPSPERTMTIAASTRVVNVAVSTRTITVPATTRTLSIS